MLCASQVSSIHAQEFTLQCDGCTIRRFTPADAAAVVEILNDTEVVQDMSAVWVLPFTLERALGFIEGSNCRLPANSVTFRSADAAGHTSSRKAGAIAALAASFAIVVDGSLAGSIGLRAPGTARAAAGASAASLPEASNVQDGSCREATATPTGSSTPKPAPAQSTTSTLCATAPGLPVSEAACSQPPAPLAQPPEPATGACYELGYFLGKQWWGRGIASAAVRALLSHVMSQQEPAAVCCVEGLVAARNMASARVLEKCGFQLVKVLPGAALNGRGEAQDLAVYRCQAEQAR